jgi:membrane-anchored protein YejM (alkaline phosphatase superfamily)
MFLYLTWLLAWIFTAFWIPTACASANIVLITLDTTRADRLSCYGYFRETTPNLDAFAEGAILFENAITHMSTTLPAHVSLFTSTYTTQHGVRGNLSPTFSAAYDPDGDIKTAALVLSELGYETAGFVSAVVLKRVTGISAGFATFREPATQECRAEETTNAVIDWLNDGAREPFFLWVHYFDPHDIYSAPTPYRRFFSTDDALIRYLKANEFTHWDRLDIQHYSNMDHGEGLGQHDFIRHDPLFGELLRVPLLLRLPGMKPGGGVRSRRLTALVDVLPTLCEELQIEIPPDVRSQFVGRNMIEEEAWDYVFSERAHGRERKLGPGSQFSLTGQDWKYYHATEKPDELYDLRHDPFELRNVIDEQPEVARRLKARILSVIAEEPRPEPAARDSLSAEYVRELRALGYID